MVLGTCFLCSVWYFAFTCKPNLAYPKLCEFFAELTSSAFDLPDGCPVGPHRLGARLTLVNGRRHWNKVSELVFGPFIKAYHINGNEMSHNTSIKQKSFVWKSWWEIFLEQIFIPFLGITRDFKLILRIEIFFLCGSRLFSFWGSQKLANLFSSWFLRNSRH